MFSVAFITSIFEPVRSVNSVCKAFLSGCESSRDIPSANGLLTLESSVFLSGAAMTTILGTWFIVGTIDMASP